MTSSTGSSQIPSGEPMTGRPLAEDDVVALVGDMPEFGLADGTWGTVLAALDDGLCEVEFTDREGEPIKTARVPADTLELLWSEEA